MTTELTSFQRAARVAGVPSGVIAKLGDWPDDGGLGIADALMDAGMTGGPDLLNLANMMNGLRPNAPLRGDNPDLSTALTSLANAVAKKPLHEWSIPELIRALTEDPDNDTVRQELERRPDYLRATARTKAVFARQGESVQPDVSHRYIKAVAKGGPILDTFDGCQMVSYGLAFGDLTTRWIHPLIKGSMITNGVDEIGLPWTENDKPRIQMAVWARDIRRHPGYPMNPDPYEGHEQLTAETLSGRWAPINQAYNTWLQEGNDPPNINVREGRPGYGSGPFDSGQVTRPVYIGDPTNLIALRNFIVEHFNIDELRMLIADLGLDYDNISGSTKSTKALELVTFHKRHGRLPELARALGWSGSVQTNQPTTEQLVQVISRRFSLSDLETACFVLGIDHEDFRHSKTDFIVDLLSYTTRTQRLEQLLAQFRRMNPAFEL